MLKQVFKQNLGSKQISKWKEISAKSFLKTESFEIRQTLLLELTQRTMLTGNKLWKEWIDWEM